MTTLCCPELARPDPINRKHNEGHTFKYDSCLYLSIEIEITHAVNNMSFFKTIIKTHIYILYAIFTYENIYFVITLNFIKFRFSFK